MPTRSKIGRLKICRIAACPFFFRHHLISTIKAILAEGHELHIITASGEGLDYLQTIPNLHIKIIEIHRDISPIQDLITLIQMFWYFYKEKFDIVHSCTPKAGILTSLAGFFSQTPVRLHTFTGQAWLLRSGWVRTIAILCDKIMLRLNTKCYADGPSQVGEMQAVGIARACSLKVIGSGSLSGIDVERFTKTRFAKLERDKLRADLNIPSGAVVISFVGRLNKDKGLIELCEAFYRLHNIYPSIYLIVIGPKEKTSGALPPETLVKLTNHPNCRILGYEPEPERFLNASDIFCLPSYREGFPNVVLEAGALELPTVGTNAIGMRDVVLNGKTGLVVDSQDAEQLFKALKTLIEDPVLRVKLGESAKELVHKQYKQTDINSKILNEYHQLSFQG